MEPCGVLVSYFTVRSSNVERTLAPWVERGVPIFADSGAFGALQQKEVIDPNVYAEWLHKFKHLFAVYASLDVIGDEHGTAANLAVLEAAGLQPLPVFHVGEPWELLDELVERYDRLALGGLVSFGRGGNVGPWLAHAFARVNGRAQLHGFGVTRWQFLQDFGWDTVDSTSWKSGARYGNQLIWNGTGLRAYSRKALTSMGPTLRRYHDVSVDQALQGASGNNALGYAIALRAMAIAQQHRRMHVPGFTIYCSGV